MIGDLRRTVPRDGGAHQGEALRRAEAGEPGLRPVVALAGPVGFVGLLVPHALRRLRPPSTRALMVGCALWGAVLVILADLAGRLVVAPGEIHLGVTTVLLGVPVLLALLRRPGVAA